MLGIDRLSIFSEESLEQYLTSLIKARFYPFVKKIRIHKQMRNSHVFESCQNVFGIISLFNNPIKLAFVSV